jgi:hypothetical protein
MIISSRLANAGPVGGPGFEITIFGNGLLEYSEETGNGLLLGTPIIRIPP